MATLRFLLAVALATSTLAAAPTLAGDHPASPAEHPKGQSEHPATAGEAAPQPGNIVAIVSGVENLQTLARAVIAADLDEALQGDGPFTVFAPTDAAFSRLPKGVLESLLKPENKDELAAILSYHVIPGRVMASDVKTMKVATVGGEELSIEAGKDGVTVGKARVVRTDLAAANGVIHVIDAVLLPAAPSKKAAEKGKPKDHPGH